jgi:hypothetical protein
VLRGFNSFENKLVKQLSACISAMEITDFYLYRGLSLKKICTAAGSTYSNGNTETSPTINTTACIADEI